MTYKIGDIVGLDEYSEAVAWCDENNATLTEIDPVDRDVEETYIEQVPVESEIVVPAVVHIEETPVSYTDESGNVIEKIEKETVVDVPEHTEKVIEYTDVEKTRIIKKTFRQFRIVEIPPYVPTHDDISKQREEYRKAHIDSKTAERSRRQANKTWTDEDEQAYLALDAEVTAWIEQNLPYPVGSE